MNKKIEETVTYTTRHLPARLLDRLRIIAASSKTTLEGAVTEAIELGLPALEERATKEWARMKRGAEGK